jgi:hypothetical protein
MLLALLLAAQEPPFPERAPGLIEDCLEAAVVQDNVRHDDEDGPRIKYMCTGDPARQLWAFLEQAKLPVWEQDTPAEGRWATRNFPLGGCFRRVRNADGTPATDGLSCSVWVPRPTAAAPPR